MELTEENLDYPDCRWPINPNNSIKTPERIEKLIAERKAKLAASRKPLPLAAG